MNRICLKRKEMQKKNMNPVCSSETNKETQNSVPSQLEDMSNSQISKTNSQSCKNEENQKIFEEFKNQYDVLRKQHDDLRKTYDDCVRQKKRVQIQLMNANPEYYQRQIKRLKTEVQKLQEDNEDLKHKYFITENSKKQMESTIKVKTEEVKRCLTQLQKQKIQSVQLKHQVTEKEKFYQRIISEMEKSTQVLSTNFQEVNKRSNKLETQLKSKQKDLIELQRDYETLSRQNIENQTLMKKNKEIFDQTNFTKTQKIDQLQSKLRGLDRQSRSTIEELQLKVEEFSNYRKTENLFMNERIESAANLKIHRQNELEVVRLEEINKELKADIENEKKLVKKLESQLLTWYSPEQYQELETKFNEIDGKRFEAAKYYEDKLLKIQKQNEVLKMNSIRNPACQQTNNNHQFQELLKSQVEQNTKMKKQLSLKVDEIYNIKAEVEEIKCKLKNSQDQVNLLKKKLQSQEKNNKIENEVSSQHLKNQIDSLNRKLETTTRKLQGKVKQVKEKQGFIMNTIIGRSRQQDVPYILSELQRIFETEYASKLSAAVERISELEKMK